MTEDQSIGLRSVMSKLRTLSTFERAGLVVALWLVLVLIGLIARNNLPVLFSHLPGLAVVCLGSCAFIIAFSMLAAAIHITLDVIRGKYPYGN
jgi:hypothetical protein